MNNGPSSVTASSSFVCQRVDSSRVLNTKSGVTDAAYFRVVSSEDLRVLRGTRIWLVDGDLTNNNSVRYERSTTAVTITLPKRRTKRLESEEKLTVGKGCNVVKRVLNALTTPLRPSQSTGNQLDQDATNLLASGEKKTDNYRASTTHKKRDSSKKPNVGTPTTKPARGKLK